MTVSQGKKKRSSSARVRRNESGIRRFSRNILLAINIFLILLLALAYLSIYINPATTAFPALFGLAYPYIAAANVAMVIVWILFRKWYALLSALALAAGFGYIHNFIRFTNQGTEEHHELKLMSYNIRLFNFYEETEKNTHSKMITTAEEGGSGHPLPAGVFCQGRSGSR